MHANVKLENVREEKFLLPLDDNFLSSRRFVGDAWAALIH